MSAYLSDLLANTLDPGYAAATERAGDEGHARTRRGALVAVCAVIGLVLGVAYAYTSRHAPATNQARDALHRKVRAAQQTADALAKQANRLAGEVAAEKQKGTGRGPTGQDLTRAEELAGTIAVDGPGLRVTMGNPPDGTRQLRDLDVRTVVNELWLAGAEAVTVNNVRLTPTSAIRFAGSSVLVDYQPLSAPYTIRAIGPADTLDARFTVSATAGKYRTLASAFGFTFDVAQSRRLHLPAAPARRNRYAVPG